MNTSQVGGVTGVGQLRTMVIDYSCVKIGEAPPKWVGSLSVPTNLSGLTTQVFQCPRGEVALVGLPESLPRPRVGVCGVVQRDANRKAGTRFLCGVFISQLGT